MFFSHILSILYFFFHIFDYDTNHFLAPCVHPLLFISVTHAARAAFMSVIRAVNCLFNVYPVRSYMVYKYPLIFQLHMHKNHLHASKLLIKPTRAQGSNGCGRVKGGGGRGVEVRGFVEGRGKWACSGRDQGSQG